MPSHFSLKHLPLNNDLVEQWFKTIQTEMEIRGKWTTVLQ